MAPLVVLLGFMGSGKTGAGAACAALLHYEFVDLDASVSSRVGKTVEALFSEEGEDAFRAAEVDVLRDLLEEWERSPRGMVLALGGGAATVTGVQDALQGKGLKIWLSVEPGVAWGRVKGSARPLAQDRGRFVRLAHERRDAYLALSDVVLDTSDLEISQVAFRLARLTQEMGDEEAARMQNPVWRLNVEGKLSRSVIEGGPGTREACRRVRAGLTEEGRRVWVVTDQNLKVHWPRLVHDLCGGSGAADALVLPPGEGAKTPIWAERGWQWLAEAGARRDDAILAFGGGVVGDLAGFLAATYLRGLELWQLPTSLLAQVDSSVGGKTAVNLPEGKNLVGAFHQPARVFIDPVFLLTLPQRELANGLGEVVKYAVLGGEAVLEGLEESADAVASLRPAAVDESVRTCVAYKAAVVGRDEREAGERAVLNLGHTTAHALERVLGYGGVGHGVAVALGVLVALRVSEVLLDCPQDLRGRTRKLMERWGLPVRLRLPEDTEILAAMKRDKKGRAGGVGFVGVKGAGEPVTGLQVPESLLRQALREIRA
ncbi:MAG: 3-dehydroquinate synthase [Gaiellales bacterium]|nr:3-dehydroquinate synthase [Gaiellales bacterium]